MKFEVSHGCRQVSAPTSPHADFHQIGDQNAEPIVAFLPLASWSTLEFQPLFVTGAAAASVDDDDNA